jgi:serine/threonine protein kinase
MSREGKMRLATQFNKGDMIDDFRVIAELGKGAASTIYVVQESRTKQVWALKHVEKNGPKDDRFLEQAETEYEVASKLNHPNIRKIVKKFKRREGLLTVKELFLVMEHVDGVSCDIKPPKTFESMVHIFHQTAEAMAHMHDSGFVHADMKPNNIVVTASGQAKLIDLGQSCKIGTVKPRIQGTPDYIAPEQVHRRPIVPKTDVYNLGATMYWVLTRRHIPTALPKGDSLVSSLDDAMIQKPTPCQEINPRIPAMLAELVMQCVEVDPADRPADMHFVADRLNLIEGVLRAKGTPMANVSDTDAEDETSPAA